MKLAFYNDFELGVIDDGKIHGVRAALGDAAAKGAQDLIEHVITEWDRYKAPFERCIRDSSGMPLGEVRLRPPVPRPSKILCTVANYKEGVEDNVSEIDFFHKSPSAIIGDGDTMVIPSFDFTIIHHELELGVVIGRKARNVPEDKALDHVFGYLIFQDASGRGINPNGANSWLFHKSFDTFAPIGPMIVTRDEIPDPQNLQVRLWANGELRQDYHTSDMAHSVARQVSVASQLNTLYPGDLMATGCNRQGLGPMQHGDVIVQEIDGLGTLTTLVEDPQRRSWPYGIDVEFAEFTKIPRQRRTRKLGPPRIVPAASVARD